MLLLRSLYRVGGHLPPPVKRWIVQRREATFLVGVIGIVLDDDGRVMLFRHSYRPFAPWGLPSGCLRPGESLADSIVREVREESGLRVEFEKILLVEAGSRPRRVDVWMRYRAIPGTSRPSAEVEEVAFFRLDELPPLIAEQERFLRDLPT